MTRVAEDRDVKILRASAKLGAWLWRALSTPLWSLPGSVAGMEIGHELVAANGEGKAAVTPSES